MRHKKTGTAGGRATLLAAAMLALSIADATHAAPASRAVPAAPLYDWSGFYVGGHAGWGKTGGASASMSTNAPGFFGPLLPLSFDVGGDGYLAGGQIGYNWQVTPNWVLGVEGDISATGIAGAQSLPAALTAPFGGPAPAGPVSMTQDINWVASVRARLGYTWTSAPAGHMIYVTGGAAWAHVDYDAQASAPIPGFPVTFPASASSTRSGWVLGGGVETMLTRNWTLRAEYLFYSFDNFTLAVPNTGSCAGIVCTATYTWNDLDIHSVRLGVNYRF